MGLHLFRKSSKKPGDAPGTIVYVGDAKDAEITMELINYGTDILTEQEVSLEELSSVEEKSGIKWLNITGIHDPELIQKIGDQFSIHKLVLEDIANTTQQSKIENYSESIFAVLKMFYLDSENEIRMEHINLVLKENILISFQESSGDVFDPVRKRIRDKRKKFYESDSDYLFYALLDAIVDNYFVILRSIGERVDTLKKSITLNASKDDLIILDKLHDDALVVQNYVLPLAKFFPDLNEIESHLIHKSSFLYFRDLNDHISQTISLLDAMKNKLSSMNDYYLSVVSNKTNEVMKTLALVATICVPITVIAGIYGMNFQHMPELSSPIAYPLVLTSMAGVGISLYSYFRRKKWV